MKIRFKYLMMTVLMLFVCSIGFAMSQDVPEVDLTSPDVIVGLLQAVLTLAATWTAKRFLPFLTGTTTLIAVPVLAGLFTLLTDYVVANELSFFMKVLTGSGSVFLHQLYLNMTGKAKKA